MPARKYLARMFLLALIFLVGCYPVIPQVVRIGLVAPFEGRYREVGYALIPAIRLAICDWAADHPGVPTAIELVAYDDGGDPEMAVEQARKLVIDPDVLIVIGHWRGGTTQAALTVYQEAGLPLVVYLPESLGYERAVNLSPSLADLEALAITTNARPVLIDTDEVTEAAAYLRQHASNGPFVGEPLWGLMQFYSLAGPVADGNCFVTGAALPADLGIDNNPAIGHPLAPLGYDAALVALSAIQSANAPTRDAVALALPAIQLEGLTGPIRFDTARRRADAPMYVYAWQAGEQHLITAYSQNHSQ